jgi:DNA-binding transcriptional ArsR family regulator
VEYDAQTLTNDIFVLRHHGLVALREDYLWKRSRLNKDTSFSVEERHEVRATIRRDFKRACLEEWKATSVCSAKL